MDLPPDDPDAVPSRDRLVRWLRVLKLLLTVILLSLAVWQGLSGALPALP